MTQQGIFIGVITILWLLPINLLNKLLVKKYMNTEDLNAQQFNLLLLVFQ